MKIHPSTCLNDPDLKDSKGLIKTAYGTDVELPIVEGHILVKPTEPVSLDHNYCTDDESLLCQNVSPQPIEMTETGQNETGQNVAVQFGRKKDVSKSI